jgi:thermitase
VSGTVGAVSNNGIVVAGVNWIIKTMPLQMLDSTGDGYVWDAIQTVNYARVKVAYIIKVSWISSGFSQALQDTIQAM